MLTAAAFFLVGLAVGLAALLIIAASRLGAKRDAEIRDKFGNE